MIVGFLSHLDLNLYAFRLPIMLELKKRGHTVYAIVPRGSFATKIEEAGILVIDYTISRQSLNPLKELGAIFAIYRAIKPLHLDILHTFTAKPNIYGTIAGKMAKVNKIVNLVEGLGSFYLENNFKSRIVRTIIETLYRVVFRLSNAIMFVNADDPSYLSAQGVVAQEKIFRINGVGIDTDVWLPREKKETRTVILMVGRAIAHKGVREYYEAARQLTPHYPTISFWYVGGVDEGNPSSLTVEEMKTPYVTYWGEQSDVGSYLAECDLFVLPSYREGLPRTILEAMSMEKAVVATDTVGCRDVVIPAETGLLVPTKDSSALKEAIEYYITHPHERQLAGKQGRKRACAVYDSKAIIQEHLRIYETITQQNL